MQREQTRLRDLEEVTGPCCVRGYMATGPPPSIGVSRVYKEHAGVRISVARSMAPKVPSIRELILQLNRKQHADAQRSFPRRQNKLPDLFSNRSPPNGLAIGQTHNADIPTSDTSTQQSLSSRGTGASGSLPPTFHKPKLAYRLSNSLADNGQSLGALITVRNLVPFSESTDEQPETQPAGFPREKTFRDIVRCKTSFNENVPEEQDTLTAGVLVCSSFQPSKPVIQENSLAVKSNQNGSFFQRRSFQSSSTESTTNTISNPPQIRMPRKPSFEPEPEPEYPDPFHGATATFQQRLMDLSALVGDTLRNERLKALKRKSKSHSRQD